jgi:hypothetical protein
MKVMGNKLECNEDEVEDEDDNEDKDDKVD